VGSVPGVLAPWALELSDAGSELTYTYDPHSAHTGISGLLGALSESGLSIKDLKTTKSSLEEIFVNLVTTQS
jgi:ABC-2 type transport system ATP-binding protein